jgi:cytoskeletal protein RodZ
VEDRELYAEYADEEEEEVTAEEGANRTFIILVSALGGLLAVAICAFVLWAFLIAPQMRAGLEAQNEAILATNTAMVATTEAEMAEALPTSTATITPTDTPRPTRTRPPTATAAPETPTATPGEGAEVVAATPSPAATQRPTTTPRPAGEEGVPDTGIGTLGAGALAVGLLFLLIVVRRMRRAV